MDVKTLRDEAEKRRIQAASDRQQAAGYEGHSAQYSQDGDLTRAQVEQEQATRLLTNAQRLEAEALTFEQQAAEKEKQAQRLDQELAELQKRIDSLNREKQSLLGAGSGGLFSII